MKYAKYGTIIIVLLLLAIVVYVAFDRYIIRKRKRVPLQQRKKILEDLHQFTMETAEATQTKPFLLYGTLLGKIRLNNIICYDYDLDYGIMEEEYDKILYYLKTRGLPPQYKLVCHNLFSWKQFQIVHRTTLLNVDLSALRIYRTNKKVYISRLAPKLYSKVYLKEKVVKYPLDWILPIQKSSFLSETAYLPNQPRKILETFYGPDYLIPNRECDPECTGCQKIDYPDYQTLIINTWNE